MRMSSTSSHPLHVAGVQAELAAHIAQEQSLALGMPMLLGSDRQVAWAHKIRQHTLDTVSAHLANLGPEAETEEMRASMAELTQERSADWWIDNRWKDAGMIVSEACGRYRSRLLYPD